MQESCRSTNQDAACYPVTLEILVEGVPLANKISGLNQSGKQRFLRRIPKDPYTGDTDWGKRSMQDDPDSTFVGRPECFRCFYEIHG